MLVLGSTSPRRAELLQQIGLTFAVQSPSIDESIGSEESPSRYVKRMSDEKFGSLIGGLSDGQVLLTADTVVVHQGQILGKPESEAQGKETLQQLSGSQHRVLSSVTVGTTESLNRQITVETKVKFRTLTKREIDAYWRTGEPSDKAGGYGIQGIGAVFVECIEGSYTNVVGLPLTETAGLLAAFNITTLT